MNKSDRAEVIEIIKEHQKNCPLVKTMAETHNEVKGMRQKLDQIYPAVKADLKKKEAYQIVGQDIKMKGSSFRFWIAIFGLVITIIIGVRTLFFK